MRNRIRLMAVPLVAALLASLGLSPAAADTGELRPNATSAINWLIEQTNDDGSLSSYGTEPDMGLTLDAALAGMVVGTSREVIDGWIDAAEPHVAKVATDNGRVAKVVLTLAAAGRSTTDFGGINPQDLVRKSVTASGYTTGHSEGTNAFGQSLAMIAMARTGELPASTVSFLVGQQCSNGGFPMYFATDATGHCDAVNTIPDPDGTAMVIMALRAGEAKGISGAGASLTKAVAWMKAQQKPNGAFTGHPTFTPSENTNSSGLVAAPWQTSNRPSPPRPASGSPACRSRRARTRVPSPTTRRRSTLPREPSPAWARASGSAPPPRPCSPSHPSTCTAWCPAMSARLPTRWPASTP